MTDFAKSKKGVTLVELIVAIAVISIVVVGTVTGVVLSQQTIIDDSLKANASLQAQQIADALVEELSGKSFDDNLSNVVHHNPDQINNAVYVDILSFPKAKASGAAAQYTIERQNSTLESTNISGTKITVAVYYNDASYVTIEAFAPDITADS